MNKIFIFAFFLSFLIFASCNSANNEPCRIESVTLIDADKDTPIKEFDPILQDGVITLSKLPTNELSLRINLNSPNCASNVATLILNDFGGGGRFPDDKPPFAYPPDKTSWRNIFGKYDYQDNYFLKHLKGKRLLIVQIRDENKEVVKDSEYQMNFTLED